METSIACARLRSNPRRNSTSGGIAPAAVVRDSDYHHRSGQPPPRKRLCQMKAKAASRQAHVVEHDDEGIDSGWRMKALGEMHRRHRQTHGQRRRERPRVGDFHHQQPDHRGHHMPADERAGLCRLDLRRAHDQHDRSGEKAARSDKSSIRAMAIAPPAARAMTEVMPCMAGSESRKARAPPREGRRSFGPKATGGGP